MEFLGPIHGLGIVGPFDEFAGDAGRDIVGGGVPNLRDRATFVVEV